MRNFGPRRYHQVEIRSVPLTGHRETWWGLMCLDCSDFIYLDIYRDKDKAEDVALRHEQRGGRQRGLNG